MAVATRRSLLGMIGSAAFVAAGSGTLMAAQFGAGATMRLRGAVRYAASGPLPPGKLTIRLEEQGLMDAPAGRIASATITSEGRRRAVFFEMQVPRAALARAIDPGFSVHLRRHGRLIAINTVKQPYRRGARNVSLKIEPIIY